jgi:hypothetical protein
MMPVGIVLGGGTTGGGVGVGSLLGLEQAKHAATTKSTTKRNALTKEYVEPFIINKSWVYTKSIRIMMFKRCFLPGRIRISGAVQSASMVKIPFDGG